PPQNSGRASVLATLKTMVCRPLCSLHSVHSPIRARTSSKDTIGSFPIGIEVEGEGDGEIGAGVGGSDTMTGPPSPAQLKYERSSETAAASSSSRFSTPRLYRNPGSVPHRKR